MKSLKHFLQYLTIILSFYQTVHAETEKVAVVTGANKGIGYAIVKGLCAKFNGKIYLTARDESRGKSAVEKLKEAECKNANLVFHQLDVTDQLSINKFRDYLKEKEGGIDVLINNAGVAYLPDTKAPFKEQVDVTMKINYFGLLHVSESLFPLLRPNGRVINLSSALGHLSRIHSPELRAKLGSPTLTIESLNELMNQFIKSANEKGPQVETEWANVYEVSKAGVSALTFIQQRNFDNEPEKRNIAANSVHPGYVNTDLTHNKGILSPEEGASAPVYLAVENHGLRGQFVWNNSTAIDWYTDSFSF